MSRPENLVNRIMDMLGDRLPDQFTEMGQDLRQNLSSLVKDSLARMDLVSHEEFEIQERILARTRERLEALEKKVAELEAELEK